ncbi:MAG: pyridoxal phosphate-dependent decarboxylase family protein [Vulcanimicrobiaceae bacterium]
MLDPTNWPAFRERSHRLLDELLDNLEHIADGPVWHELPEEIQARLRSPMPQEPSTFEAVCDEFVRDILPYPTGNQHPRFFGWVHGTATPSGALADLAASFLNSNLGGRNHGAVYVERQVIRWFADLFSFPQSASGLLTVGTSVANLLAVVVARSRALGHDVRERGLREGPALVGYASTATHACVRKAFEISGIGSNALRVLPVDDDHRLDPRLVHAEIARDRAAGLVPFLVVGNAGTVDTGAIDPLDELADLAAAERIWFHVDGAFGALAALAPSLRPLLHGIERADSLAFDFHKWLHVPYDAGCVLVTDGELHRATFASEGPYITRMTRGLAGASPWFTDYGIDLSRSFRALKVWFAIKEHGAARLGASIEHNVRLAHRLAELVMADPQFELLAPVCLNIVCFRYLMANADDGVLDRFNDELVIRLQESGRAVTSSTTIDGKRAIRVNLTNHRTCEADLHILLEALRDIAAGMRSEPSR